MANLSVERALPAVLVAAGVLALLVSGIEAGPRSFLFATAIVCATGLVVIGRGKDSGESRTEFKVSVKEISFVHMERPKSDRPPTTAVVSDVFEHAKTLQGEGKFAEAAALYAKAFTAGGEYWAAKVNEAYCYQVMGKLDLALRTYSMIEAACPVPRFRRQALGNAGEIYRAMAYASEDEPTRLSLGARAYEKYAAAVAAEDTFVSTYNLWQASWALGRVDDAARLLEKLRSSPEFDSLPQDQQLPSPPLTLSKEPA